MAKKVTKNLSQESFLEHLNKIGNRGYMKKPKSYVKTWLWWENKERWFMNIANEIRKKGVPAELDKSRWITAKDLPTHLRNYESQGYQFYPE